MFKFSENSLFLHDSSHEYTFNSKFLIILYLKAPVLLQYVQFDDELVQVKHSKEHFLQKPFSL
jgi:hypothetical protein